MCSQAQRQPRVRKCWIRYPNDYLHLSGFVGTSGVFPEERGRPTCLHILIRDGASSFPSKRLDPSIQSITSSG